MKQRTWAVIAGFFLTLLAAPIFVGLVVEDVKSSVPKGWTVLIWHLVVSGVTAITSWLNEDLLISRLEFITLTVIIFGLVFFYFFYRKIFINKICSIEDENNSLSRSREELQARCEEIDDLLRASNHKHKVISAELANIKLTNEREGSNKAPLEKDENLIFTILVAFRDDNKIWVEHDTLASRLPILGIELEHNLTQLEKRGLIESSNGSYTSNGKSYSLTKSGIAFAYNSRNQLKPLK